MINQEVLMPVKKILTIDDDRSTIRLNENLLSSQGYQVISASDGIKGVLLAQEEQPDVILLDLILPGMYGFEVCKKLKSDEKTKHIPIIIVTGSGLEEVAQKEPEIQAEAYLTKPYDLVDLMNVIQKVNSKHSS